jgi:hypothetical protein
MSAAVWAPYVDIAGMDTQAQTFPVGESSQQLSALGIKVMPYTDPNHFVSGVIGKGVGVDSYFIDSDIARACDGTKIQIEKAGQNPPYPYLIDVRSPHVQIAWNGWLSNYVLVQKKVLNVVFEDTSDNSTFHSAKPSGPCATVGGNTIVSAADWTTATAANEAALQAPVLFNGLNSGPANALLNGPAIGGMNEVCFSDWLHITRTDPGPYMPSIAEWQRDAATEIEAKAWGKVWDCQATVSNVADSANALAYRLFMIASVDLDVDVPNQIVSWRFKTPNGVPIFPEAQLVMLDPLKPDPAAVADLLEGDVYAREYAHCYIGGKEVVSTSTAAHTTGCVAVVNANGRKTYPNPFATVYKRTLVLAGDDVLDGGTMKVSNTLPPATLAPSTGAIEFK